MKNTQSMNPDTSQFIGDLVASIGVAYSQYRDLFVEQHIHTKFLSLVTSDEFEQLLKEDFQIQSILHRKQILSTLLRFLKNVEKSIDGVARVHTNSENASYTPDTNDAQFQQEQRNPLSPSDAENLLSHPEKSKAQQGSDFQISTNLSASKVSRDYSSSSPISKKGRSFTADDFAKKVSSVWKQSTKEEIDVLDVEKQVYVANNSKHSRQKRKAKSLSNETALIQVSSGQRTPIIEISEHEDVRTAQKAKARAAMRAMILDGYSGSMISTLVPVIASANLEESESASMTLVNSVYPELEIEGKDIKNMLKLLTSSSLVILENISKTLEILTSDAKNAAKITYSGGIKALVPLLSSRSIQVQQDTALALSNCTYKFQEQKLKKFFVSSGVNVIEALISVLASTTDMKIQSVISVTLQNLACDDEIEEMIGRKGGIQVLLSLLNSACVPVQKAAAGALVTLSYNDTNKVIIASSGGIEALTALLDSRSVAVQRNSTGVLLNLALNKEIRLNVVWNRTVQLLVQLVSSKGILQRNVLWTLASFSEDTLSNDVIAHNGGVESLLTSLTSKGEYVHWAVYALWGLCANNANKLKILQINGVEILLPLLASTNVALQQNVTAIFCKLACMEACNESTVMIDWSAAIKELILQLDSGTETVVNNILACLYNLVVESPTNAAKVVQNGGVQVLTHLLHHKSNAVQKNSADTLGVLGVDDHESKGEVHVQKRGKEDTHFKNNVQSHKQQQTKNIPSRMLPCLFPQPRSQTKKQSLELLEDEPS